MKKKLMLVDGHSILNRAYYGLPPLTSPDGTPTGAMYGFLNILFKFLDEEKPDALAVAFDVSAPTFRHERYKEYKGTRKPMDPDLKVQVPLIKEILQAMNITIVEKPGWEADDIIGTLSKRFSTDGNPVTIVSGDKDLLQLVDENITMKNPKTSRGQTTVVNYTPADVFEEYGVTPHEFILLKAIMGDTSDNIPGVKGIGPKTAAPIVARYHTLDEVIAHIDDLSSASVKKKMADGVESMKLSYFLAEIDTNADLDFEPEKAGLEDMFNDRSYELFSKYNFKTMLGRFSDKPKPKDIKLPETVFVKDRDRAEKVMDEVREVLKKDGHIGLSVLKMEKQENIMAFLAGEMPKDIAVCTGEERLYLFSMTSDIDGEFLNRLISDISKEEKGVIYINDVKALARLAGREEANFTCRFRDVALSAYLVDPLPGKYLYCDIAAQHLGVNLPDEKELKKEPEKMTALDAWVSFMSGDMLVEKVKGMEMTSVLEKIENPLIPILASMEKYGIKTDKEALKAYGGALGERIDELTKSITKQAGEEFNINSPKALGSILFEKLELPHGKKTKTGYSTAADVLENLAPDYPIVSDILEYRTLTKLKSTYADALSEYIEDDGRIHGDFNQTVTATGRLSSANPNLQNIPVRMDIGRQIRKVFVPEEGFVFVDADYSQIELRLLAHMSGDEKLIEAYRSAEDIHAITASQVFGVPLDEVTPLQRRNAKAVNFGIIYGISSFGLGRDLSISVSEAKQYIENYFKTYPGIKSFLDGLVASAKKKGYSETIYGRRRPIPELKNKNFMTRSFGERVAMNAPIQGSAADIMKLAMLKIDENLRKNNLKSRLLLQVHDEVLVEAAEDEKAEVKTIVKESMEGAAKLKVPLTVDINEGKNWYEAH